MPISNPTVSRPIASGTYTGDGTNSRTISVGFDCALVIVMSTTASERTVFIDNGVITDTGAAHNQENWNAIYRTLVAGGFMVSNACVNTNLAVYYYVAIGV